MIQLKCGCTLHGSAIAYCRSHSERNPPPQFREDRTNAEHAAQTRKGRQTYQETDAGPLPELERARKQRWNAQTGELEDA